MLNTWNTFAEELKSNKKINAYNIFTRHQPIKDNNKLVIELVSLSEKAEFEDIQMDLLNSMKTNLKNNNISIKICITKEEKKNLIFTKKEKYQYLVGKNENLKLLQEKLELNTT